MEPSRRIKLPRRKMRKVTLTLPIDTVEFLDECGGAQGLNRSNCLTSIIDGFWDEIAAWAKGRAQLIDEQSRMIREAAMDNAKGAARSMGMTLARPSGSDS